MIRITHNILREHWKTQRLRALDEINRTSNSYVFDIIRNKAADRLERGILTPWWRGLWKRNYEIACDCLVYDGLETECYRKT